MYNQVKPVGIEFIKFCNIPLMQAGQIAIKFVGNHKVRLLTLIALAAIVDDWRVHYDRSKKSKKYEESSIKIKNVIRKQEAEINVLKAESDQAQEVAKRLDQLEQIIKNITEKGIR